MVFFRLFVSKMKNLKFLSLNELGSVIKQIIFSYGKLFQWTPRICFEWGRGFMETLKRKTEEPSDFQCKNIEYVFKDKVSILTFVFGFLFSGI